MNPPTPPLPPIAPPPTLSTSHKILVWLCFLMGLGLCVFKALIWGRGVWSADVIGYGAGAVMVSLVISYLIAGRKKVYNPVRLGLWFFGCSLFFLYLESATPHPTPQQEAIEIIREEMAGVPPDKQRFTRDPEAQLLRSALHDFVAESKAKHAQLDALDPDLEKLYTAESFSSPAAMQRSLDAANQMYAIDHDLLTLTQEWPQRAQEKLAQSPVSQDFKQSFLESLNDALTNSDVLVLRKQADPIELRWRDATVALYQFTLANASHVQIKDGKILLDNRQRLDEFNDLLTKAIAARDELHEANLKVTKSRDRMLQNYGTSMKDLTQPSPASSGQP